MLFPTLRCFGSSSPSLQCLRRSSRVFARNAALFSTESTEPEPRERMAFDVLIVGGGPAGLAASIQLKQLNDSLSVCVIDKGSEIGSHILSGNVFDPKASPSS